MLKVVLDTNVVVSALLSKRGNPLTIVEAFIKNELSIFYSRDIFLEYEDVLKRPKLSLLPEEIRWILEKVMEKGTIVTVAPSIVKLPDESDRVFYDVAKSCEAYLITGNKKHFPEEPFILTPADFCQRFL